MTSDLILDEIDQYDGEDLAAIARLVYQAGAAGRRVMAMSATLTPDIAQALYLAYRTGWADHARATGCSAHVNLLMAGDAPRSICTNAGDEDIDILLARCRAALLAGIAQTPALRRAAILPKCESWDELVAQISLGATQLHQETAVRLRDPRREIGVPDGGSPPDRRLRDWTTCGNMTAPSSPPDRRLREDRPSWSPAA